MRQRLPDRRLNATRKITWITYGGNERTIIVTFGFREMIGDQHLSYEIAEVFCADFKAGSDTLGIVTDTCILISRLFQLGERPEVLLRSMCEPHSLIGTILKTAAEEEAVMQAEAAGCPTPTEESTAPRDTHLGPLLSSPPRPWLAWLYGWWPRLGW